MQLEGRHVSTIAVAQYFSFDHLPQGKPRNISELCAEFAQRMVSALPDSPELTVGLRKLLEAKDAFVRAAL